MRRWLLWQEKARVVKLVADATRMMAVLGPVVLSGSAIMDDKSFKSLPKAIQSKLKSAVTALFNTHTECKNVVTGKSTAALEFTLEEVREMVKTGTPLAKFRLPGLKTRGRNLGRGSLAL